MTVQVATRVPGSGGGRGSNALVVVLHLQSDGPPQPPEDVEQAFEDQLPLLLWETPGLVSTNHRDTQGASGVGWDSRPDCYTQD